jgi:hypothetical protein
MLPGIFVFKQVIGDDVKEDTENGKNGDDFCKKGYSCQLFPVSRISFIF